MGNKARFEKGDEMTDVLIVFLLCIIRARQDESIGREAGWWYLLFAVYCFGYVMRGLT